MIFHTFLVELIFKVNSATPKESVMHGQEPAEIRQTLNSAESSNNTPNMG